MSEPPTYRDIALEACSVGIQHRDEVAALREQLTAALARITALEAAGRPVVEMLEQRRVSLYGAADAFVEKVNRLKRVLEEQ
jgi:hypothetical protein